MISVTRRLILSVLLTEAAAGLALITALGFHEYRLQRSTFDTTLRSSAETLLGAVQDAEDAADNVMLDNGA
ncbi:MAG TPA: sensor histidine kinase, partial [Edaphobacter sp.]